MRELRVTLDLGVTSHAVGTLVEDGRRVWFAYDDDYAGPEISPYALAVQPGLLLEHRVKRGVPLPGVFADSRPDGWGLKLLHRAFVQAGRAPGAVSPLEELAYLGSRTMGALTYAPATGPPTELEESVALGALAAHARQVYDDTVEEVLPALVRAGGSPGGARPKALIALRDDGGPGVRHGDGDIPDGWSAWLVKFRASHEDRDIARREHAWMRMAAAAGLDVPATRVLALGDGEEAFAVCRFDRGAGRRAHLLSAAGALDVDFRHAAADYTDLLRLGSLICSGDLGQLAAGFRLAAFNVAAANDDDHLKNIAWLYDGRWRLAPAYDLTFAPDARGRATTVAGAGREVARDDLLRLADAVGLRPNRATAILDEVTAATANVADHLADAGCERRESLAAVAVVAAATDRLR